MTTGVMITLIICGTIVILSIGSIIRACIVQSEIKELIYQTVMECLDELVDKDEEVY